MRVLSEGQHHQQSPKKVHPRESMTTESVGPQGDLHALKELVPMGPFDAQKILKAPTAQERLDLIEDQIEAFKEILDARE